jgi:hypothetical protein
LCSGIQRRVLWWICMDFSEQPAGRDRLLINIGICLSDYRLNDLVWINRMHNKWMNEWMNYTVSHIVRQQPSIIAIWITQHGNNFRNIQMRVSSANVI